MNKIECWKVEHDDDEWGFTKKVRYASNGTLAKWLANQPLGWYGRKGACKETVVEILETIDDLNT